MKTTFISSQTCTSMVILELSCYLQTGYLLRMLTCYIPFHSSDSDSFSDLILDSVNCHCYYIARIPSLSFHMTLLHYLFTPVSDQKPDNGL